MNAKHLEQVTALRHLLHSCPELSMQETRTKQILMDFLRTHTSLEITDCGHWFYAFYRSPNPSAETIAFRADFDALPIPETCSLPYISAAPGLGHKCGHDGHSAALAGFALEIDKLGADVSICFLFQHAEETGQGAEQCLSVLSEKQISRIFAVHNRSGYPEGSIVCKNGLIQCASRGLTVSFTGTPSHASEPEKGRNPAFAAAALTLDTRTLLRSDLFEDMVLCTIVHTRIGEKDFGISPGTGEVSMTLRANRESDLDKLEQHIRLKALSLAKEEELEVCFSISDPFPETRNENGCVRLVEAAAAALGNPYLTLSEPWRASEDFGHYTRLCPGALFYVGNGTDYPPLHTGDYDFNDRTLETIVDMYCELTRLSAALPDTASCS